MRILLPLLILLLACKPGDNGGKKDARSDHDELLVERVADSSVPVSGTNLVFAVEPGVDEESIDAYIVGYPDTLTARNIGQRVFLIENVPSGAQELIVTGKTAAGLDAFDRGLRLTAELVGGRRQDIGNLQLPATGSLQGRLEMEGVAAFQTVTVNFPGTRLPAVKPAADGRYAFNNLPIGAHTIGALQTENPTASLSLAAVQNGVPSTARRFVVRSEPNIPSNLAIVSRSSSLLLSWSTGGGETEGYLLYKSTLADANFKPKNGMSYQPGAADDGDIISVGSAAYYADPAAKNGTRYYYQIFAYNRNRVYSEPLHGSAEARPQDYAYNNYRLFIDSAASACEGDGSTQIQNLRFHIDNLWYENDFSANRSIGKIGPYTVNVSTNSLYNNSYEAFYAFQSNNLPWSSEFNAFAATEPFDVNRTKYPGGVYINIQVANTAIQITGLDIRGGEPPFLRQCAPDRYHMEGSNDGLNWALIPGSTHTQSTVNGVRYYFTPQLQPLTPERFLLLGNAGQVKASWESAAGRELGFLLARSQTPVPFIPEKGRSYTAGKQGDYDIVMIGNALEYLDSGLDSTGAIDYYTLLSFDENLNYSTAVIGRAVPEPRPTFRYYRFAVDSILGGEGMPAYSSWVDDVKLQVNGQWVSSYVFTGPLGKIAGRDVRVSESSVTGTNRAWQIFADGNWQSADGRYYRTGQSHAVAKSGEYVQLDFGAGPLAITGFQVLGNSTLTADTLDFQALFSQIPDGMHWERSQDGVSWEVIPGSRTTNFAAERVTLEW